MCDPAPANASAPGATEDEGTFAYVLSQCEGRQTCEIKVPENMLPLSCRDCETMSGLFVRYQCRPTDER